MAMASSLQLPALRRPHPRSSSSSFPFSRPLPTAPLVLFPRRCTLSLPPLRAKAAGDKARPSAEHPAPPSQQQQDKEEEEEEVEEDLPWIQDKALDLVEFSGTVTQAIPGPRVGQSSLPWLLAVPLAYLGVSFVVAVFKAYRKVSSPKFKKKQQVNKNLILCQSVDELFLKGRDEVQHSSLTKVLSKTGFSMEELLRKYIRYALNEKPFNPDLVMDLIHLRKASMLGDTQVAEVLNEISRRIVKEKGPVVMDMSGFTEKGLKRKLAVQALFGKVFYLSELPEFCARDSSLIVKEIFGVTDEDTDTLRIHTLPEAGDVDSLDKMMDGPDSEEEISSSGKEDPNNG